MGRSADVPCFVYVIGYKGRPDWPKKIGVANDVASRFAAHQTSNPYELEVLITMPGDERVEAKLHAHFSTKRVRGEWFDLDAADLAWIVAVDPAAVPDTVPCGPGETCSIWLPKPSKTYPHGFPYRRSNRPCPEPAVGRLAAEGFDGALYCAPHLVLAAEPHQVCDMPDCGGDARFNSPWGGRLLCPGHVRAMHEGRKIPPGPPPAWALELLAPPVPDGSTCPDCNMPSAGNTVFGRPELCLLHDAWLRQPDASRCEAGVPSRAVAVPGGKWVDRLRFVAEDGGCPFPGRPLVHEGAELTLCAGHRYLLIQRGSVDWEYDPLRDNDRVKPTLARK